MPVIRVSMVSRGDPPPWADVADRGVMMHPLDEPWHLAAIGEATRAGKPGVMIRLDWPDGRTVLAETTLTAWISATAAMRGAFPEAFKGTPLEAP